MKKLVLTLAIFGFVAFGVVNVQNIVAASLDVEMVNFDKDPKKDEKKAVESKDSKAEMKSGKDCCAKDKASSCGDKSTMASAGCCSKDKASSCSDKSAMASADCCATSKSGSVSACPDKK